MQERTDPILQDTLYTERLDNGLTVCVLRRPGFHTKTAWVTTHYGALDSTFVPPGGEEIKVPDGIAHFLEHKMFESPQGDAMDLFSELGADTNAHTTWTHTAYYFNTTQNFEQCLDVLLNMVQEPYFTDETVEKEQGIIEQEIRMYLDNPGWRSNMNFLECVYAEYPVRIDIAGTVESIHQINKDLLYLCHKTFYHPSNMVVFVGGDVDPAKVIEQVRQNFDRHGYEKQGEIKRIFPDEPRRLAELRKSEKLTVSQPIIRLGFKDVPVGEPGQKLLHRDFLTSLVLDAIIGRSSPLFTELYESGLIDNRFGYEHTAEVGYGYTYFAGPTKDPKALEARLLAGIANVKETGLNAADFERSKKKSLGRMLASMNAVESVAYWFSDLFFKECSVFDMLPIIDSLTLEEANARLQEHFDLDNYAVSLIEPRG